MSNDPRDEREQRALDALIAASLRQGEEAEVTDEDICEFLGSNPPLSPSGKAALEALGPEVMRTFTEGKGADAQPAHDLAMSATPDSMQFAAMHRKNATGQNTTATEQELERKRQEILARLRKKKEAGP